MKKDFCWYMMKLDRIAAWTLLATMFAYFISGYGMTKGIIDANLAVNIHDNWLPFVLLSSFCFHTGYAISLSLKRWKIWNPVVKYILLAIYLAFFGYFVHLNFHKGPISSSTGSTSTISQTAESESQDDDTEETTTQSTTTQDQTTTTKTTKTFTAAELAKYNGQNGMPAYAAVSGKVYDFSAWFTGGSHFSHLAGQDLTDAFYSRHSAASLSRLTVVGTYSP